MTENDSSNQFLAILKKDIKLVFTKKNLIFMFIIPFTIIAVLTALPMMFNDSYTFEMTISIRSADIGSAELHVNGTSYNINLGQEAINKMSALFRNNPEVIIKLTTSRDGALNSSYGFYFPSNFLDTTFDGQSSYEFRTVSDSGTRAGMYFAQAMTMIDETIEDRMLFLNNVSDMPDVEPDQYIPPPVEQEGWSSDTLSLAVPFGYAILLFVSMSISMGKNFGFGKEREDGTLETMLTITRKRSHIVLSKILVGVMGAFLSITAYFAGSLIGGLPALLGDDIIDDFSLILSLNAILSGNGILLLLSIVFCLSLAIIMLIVFETTLKKPLADTIGIPVVILLGMLFFFPIVINPQSTLFITYINPFHWIYHPIMALIDGSFGWIDGLFLALFIGLFALLIVIATKAIEREKVIYS